MKIAYVNLFVSDIDRAVDFYTSTLGLELGFSDPEHGYASINAGPIQLGLAVTDSKELVGRHTGIGLAIEDLEAEHKRLVDLGVAFESPPTRQPWGGFMALVQDPDGNIFYLDEVSAAHAADGD
jgi:predicted enzyme related to lactoylglutathione lyase